MCHITFGTVELIVLVYLSLMQSLKKIEFYFCYLFRKCAFLIPPYAIEGYSDCKIFSILCISMH